MSIFDIVQAYGFSVAESAVVAVGVLRTRGNTCGGGPPLPGSGGCLGADGGDGELFVRRTSLFDVRSVYVIIVLRYREVGSDAGVGAGRQGKLDQQVVAVGVRWLVGLMAEVVAMAVLVSDRGFGGTGGEKKTLELRGGDCLVRLPHNTVSLCGTLCISYVSSGQFQV